MKLFKKVLAVVLVGAMAVSMLTACGSSEIVEGEGCPEGCSTSRWTPLRWFRTPRRCIGRHFSRLTEKVTSGTVDPTNGRSGCTDHTVESLVRMTDYSFNDAAGSSTGAGKYDLYIWTNGADGHQVTEQYGN